VKVLALISILVAAAAATVPASGNAQNRAMTPKDVARYLVGTWGLVAVKADLDWFEMRSRCGSIVTGAISQPVDQDMQDKVVGVPFDKKINRGKTIKSMLAFGQSGSDLAVISRFKQDNSDEMFGDSVKPKFKLITAIEPTNKPNEFLIGKIPGFFSERTIRIVSLDKMILLSAAEDKGGVWGSIPDREFRRCANTDEVRNLEE